MWPTSMSRWFAVNLLTCGLYHLCFYSFCFSSLCSSLVMVDNEPVPPNEEESEHDRRKIELSRQDPVHTVGLRDYLCSQMRTLRESLGEHNFEELMGQVDVETMQQLKTYLDGGNSSQQLNGAGLFSGDPGRPTLHTPSNPHPT